MHQKIVTREEISAIASQLHVQHKTIITTNGTFDILHAGHVQFLEEARGLGDVLIVGLNSDSSVKKYKGDKRPINSQDDRALVLGALQCVDYVVIFNEPEPSMILNCIKPDIHVKAADYTLDTAKENPQTKIWERDIVEKNGGQVKILPLLSGKSTTNIIKKIVETYRDEKEYKKCSSNS